MTRRSPHPITVVYDPDQIDAGRAFTVADRMVTDYAYWIDDAVKDGAWYSVGIDVHDGVAYGTLLCHRGKAATLVYELECEVPV